MKIVSGSNRLVSGGRYTFKEIKLQPVVYGMREDIKYVVLVSTPDENQSDYLHYLEINLTKQSKGNILLQYVPQDKEGVCSFKVFQQHQYIDPFVVYREQFDTTFFAKDLKLQVVLDVTIDVTHEQHHEDIIKEDTKLTEKQQKYCSCILKVQNNPYAICGKSVNQGVNRKCTPNYNFEKMSDNLLRAYIRLHDIEIEQSVSHDRKSLLEAIYKKLGY